MFSRYVGIDYSGAGKSTRANSGIQVYLASHWDAPVHKQRPNSRFNWSRQSLYEWLLEILAESNPTIVGIDHAFSFPVECLHERGIGDWDGFLAHFCKRWPTDTQEVAAVRRRGVRLMGSPEMFRLTDRGAGTARSVFDFGEQGGLQGQVATSTHAGIPWLNHLRAELGEGVHFWPFDGFHPIPGRSVVAEVYPRLFRAGYPRHVFEEIHPRPNYLAASVYDHYFDAWMACSWLRDKDLAAELGRYLTLQLNQKDRDRVRIEGWMLGLLEQA